LETFILSKLKNGASLSGYDFVAIINRQFNFLLSPGTVYSALYSLERKGLIKPVVASSRRNKKRVYSITQEGRQLLAINEKFENDLVSLFRGILAS
jgi:DNA-binding PadR family transcriptional regulator